MKWLLDTNVISETARTRPHRAVFDWIATKTPDDLAISIVTLSELLYGASTHRDDMRRRDLLSWIETAVAEAFRERTLALTTDVLTDWLGLARQLRTSSRSRDAADLLIAATARVHDLTIVTRNVKDFADAGVIVYNPWNGKTHRMDLP